MFREPHNTANDSERRRRYMEYVAHSLGLDRHAASSGVRANYEESVVRKHVLLSGQTPIRVLPPPSVRREEIKPLDDPARYPRRGPAGVPFFYLLSDYG